MRPRGNSRPNRNTPSRGRPKPYDSKPRPKPIAKAKPAPKSDDGLERLHVRIAHAGVCSRRAAEKLIAEGRVEVNGVIISGMGHKVSETDEVKVDGIRVGGASKSITVIMNKPKGVVTTMSDPQGRPTIANFMPEMGAVLKPVGRLDMDTEGLLILSSDGELANRLTHPSYGVEKEYHVTIEGIPDEKALEKLRTGVYIEGGKTAPAVVEMVFGVRSGTTAKLKMIIHEGRNRQIRLMCEAVGHRVTALRRVRIGHLSVKGMRQGEVKIIPNKELNVIRESVGLEPI